MKKLIYLLAVLIALAIPSHAKEAGLPEVKQPSLDIRALKLEAFFIKHKCPQPYYTNDYLSSADKYNIPFILLPAISVAESSCGRHQRYNNWWGYWSDSKGFSSVSEGVDYVSSQLANGRYYKGKTLDQILRAYNPNPSYTPKK